MSKNPNGAGSFRRQSGKWNYRITYRDEFGLLKRKSITAPTQLECLEQAELFLLDIEGRHTGPGKEASITELLNDKYIRDLRKNYITEASFSAHRRVLRSMERHAVVLIPIASVTQADISEFLEYIAAEYSDSIIKNMHHKLKLAYQLATAKGILKRNLMDSPELRRPRSRRRKTGNNALSIDEQRRFEEALETYNVNRGSNDFRLQLLIELHSGLRMGEINALRPSDIDLNEGVIHIGATVSEQADGSFAIKKGAKTAAGNRDVPISSALKPYLEGALLKARPEANPYGLIFYNYNSDSVIPTKLVNDFFNRVLAKAGIRKRGQHSLRHTFATRCIEAGIPAIVLKNWLGHTNIHITLDTYAEVFDELNFDAINKVNEGWFKTDNDQDISR